MATSEPESTFLTHKEVQGLADDYIHDWPVESVPRNPSFYQPVPATHPKGWSHFIAEKKDRKISGDVVEACIRNGDVFPAEWDNRYRFIWRDPTSLVPYSLIVELRSEAFAYKHEKHYCITVYRIER